MLFNSFTGTGEPMNSSGQVALKEIVGKRLWVTYRLQSLTTEKFAEVANKILRGEHKLMIRDEETRETVF
jgi:hypothetical protein